MYNNINIVIYSKTLYTYAYVHTHIYKTHTYNISCYIKWYAVSYEVQCGVPPRLND
jgi:hypothetical protein